MSKVTNAGEAEAEISRRIVPMRVIVCSLMRTGTLSLRAALRQLGIHDVYHMQTLGTNSNDIALWNRAIDAKYLGRGTFTRDDWDTLLGSYQATTDIPASFFAVELAAAYPEARVIILHRDPEKWYASCMSSIYAAFSSISLFDKLLILLADPTLRTFGGFMRRVDTICQGFAWPERDKALAFFHRSYSEFHDKIEGERWDGRVRIGDEQERSVGSTPRPRVLEYHIQDGWAPLCAHLSVPVPRLTNPVTGEIEEAPFPRLNDGAAMRAAARIKMRKMRWRVFLRLVEGFKIVALVGMAVYLGWHSVVWKAW